MQSEIGLRGDRGVNVGNSAFLNEKAVTDLYILWWLLWKRKEIFTEVNIDLAGIKFFFSTMYNLS